MCYVYICVYEHVCVRACMYLFLLKGGGQKEEAEVERTLQAEGRACANLGRQRSSCIEHEGYAKGPAYSLDRD